MLFLGVTTCELSTTSSAISAQNDDKNNAVGFVNNDVSTTPSSHIIKIKALIDGADVVKIQGNKLWYEHESWELPGRWNGSCLTCAIYKCAVSATTPAAAQNCLKKKLIACDGGIAP